MIPSNPQIKMNHRLQGLETSTIYEVILTQERRVLTENNVTVYDKL